MLLRLNFDSTLVGGPPIVVPTRYFNIFNSFKIEIFPIIVAFLYNFLSHSIYSLHSKYIEITMGPFLEHCSDRLSIFFLWNERKNTLCLVWVKRSGRDCFLPCMRSELFLFALRNRLTEAKSKWSATQRTWRVARGGVILWHKLGAQYGCAVTMGAYILNGNLGHGFVQNFFYMEGNLKNSSQKHQRVNIKS